jgi:hypothetical protein
MVNADLEQRFTVLDLAQALADVDDPGAWWTLTGQGRARYEAMALVAIDVLDYRAGFRDAINEQRARLAVYCLDCCENTVELGEYFMLRDDVWLEANSGGNGMLCVGCVEERLGRHLRPDDFTDADVNRDEFGSARLRSRMRWIADELEEAPAA